MGPPDPESKPTGPVDEESAHKGEPMALRSENRPSDRFGAGLFGEDEASAPVLKNSPRGDDDDDEEDDDDDMEDDEDFDPDDEEEDEEFFDDEEDM